MKPYAIVILILIISTMVSAQDTLSYKHAIGYDGGISYQRKVASKYWVDLSFYGSHDFDGREYKRWDINDSLLSWDKRKISQGEYILSIALIKKWLRFKFIEVDLYSALSPGINYYTSADYDWGYSFKASLGCIPSAIIFKRIKLGTKFGLSGHYKEINKIDDYSGNKITDFRETINVYTFGPRVSINMTLNLYILF